MRQTPRTGFSSYLDQHGPYKLIMACLQCRHVFKRPHHVHEMTPKEFLKLHPQKCPNCGNPMYHAGRNFKAPPKSDEKSWKVVEALLKEGYTYGMNLLKEQSTEFASAHYYVAFRKPPTRLEDVPAFIEMFRKEFGE